MQATAAVRRALEVAKHTHRRPLPKEAVPLEVVEKHEAKKQNTIPFEATKAAFEATMARKRARAAAAEAVSLAAAETEKRAKREKAEQAMLAMKPKIEGIGEGDFDEASGDQECVPETWGKIFKLN